jgi:hypothetical protein
VDSLGICLVGKVWVKEWTLLRITWHKRGPLVIWTDTIEQPCSDVLAHTLEVCKSAHLYNGYPASKDDHDS